MDLLYSDPDTQAYVHPMHARSRFLVLLTNPDQPLSPLLLAHLSKLADTTASLAFRMRLIRRDGRNTNLDLGGLKVGGADCREAFNRRLGASAWRTTSCFCQLTSSTAARSRTVLSASMPFHRFSSYKASAHVPTQVLAHEVARFRLLLTRGSSFVTGKVARGIQLEHLRPKLLIQTYENHS